MTPTSSSIEDSLICTASQQPAVTAPSTPIETVKAVPFLRVQNLSFSYGTRGYGTRKVLEGVSFHVCKGEFVALVGPNGSGKSTLVKLLTRILKPGSGTVEIGGAPLSSLKPVDLAARVGVVAQEATIEFDFTAFEVALMGRTPHLGSLGGESKRDLEITAEVMALTGTTHLSERSIQQVSGGERQRVMVARALAQEPEALLLDEPTSHLDINHQAELLELVLRLCHERGLAALAVLHDLNLASTYADRILVLHQGRIAAAGPPAEVLNPERIQEVFGARTLVILHPETGRPVVLLHR